MKTVWNYTPETVAATNKINPDVIEGASQRMGVNEGEPIIIMLDALLKYAKAYKALFEADLADDRALWDHWFDAIKGVRRLLNGDGAIAMQKGITTDSKSNGACEDVFWKALEAAGYKGKDL